MTGEFDSGLMGRMMSKHVKNLSRVVAGPKSVSG
jgi:hypothetical protein